jgi:hypothetical protein
LHVLKPNARVLRWPLPLDAVVERLLDAVVERPLVRAVEHRSHAAVAPSLEAPRLCRWVHLSPAS